MGIFNDSGSGPSEGNARVTVVVHRLRQEGEGQFGAMYTGFLRPPHVFRSPSREVSVVVPAGSEEDQLLSDAVHEGMAVLVQGVPFYDALHNLHFDPADSVEVIWADTLAPTRSEPSNLDIIRPKARSVQAIVSRLRRQEEVADDALYTGFLRGRHGFHEVEILVPVGSAEDLALSEAEAERTAALVRGISDADGDILVFDPVDSVEVVRPRRRTNPRDYDLGSVTNAYIREITPGWYNLKYDAFPDNATEPPELAMALIESTEPYGYGFAEDLLRHSRGFRAAKLAEQADIYHGATGRTSYGDRQRQMIGAIFADLLGAGWTPPKWARGRGHGLPRRVDLTGRSGVVRMEDLEGLSDEEVVRRYFKGDEPLELLDYDEYW